LRQINSREGSGVVDRGRVLPHFAGSGLRPPAPIGPEQTETKAVVLESPVTGLVAHHDLLRLDIGATVADAVAALTKHRVSALLIYDGDAFAGLISDRIIIREVVNEGLDPKTTPVTDVMVRDPASIAPGATALEAVEAMKQNRARHLLVKDGDTVVEIIAISDVLRSVFNQAVQDRAWNEDLFEGFPV
jgi:CBS domain-containing protein